MSVMAIEMNHGAGSKLAHIPELLEMPASSHCSRHTTLAEGALWFLRARAESHSLRALKTCLEEVRDGLQIEPVIAGWKKREAAGANGIGECGTVNLLYCGSPILSIDGSSGPFVVGPAPYPGGQLAQRRFSVFEYPPASRSVNNWQYLLIAQPPTAGALEQLVNTRVSGEVDEFICGTRTSDRSWAPLFPVEGGWAVGGVTAIREVRRLRESWNLDKPISSSLAPRPIPTR